MHSYLIIAHNNFDQLGVLLSLIDDTRNDIYLHIDKNSSFTDSDRLQLLSCTKYSNLIFVPRVKVKWGAYSQIEAELNLLISATKHGYEYYHLLSGADLPLKSQDYIHDFYRRNSGLEFVHFGDYEWFSSASDRLKYYWLFQNSIGHSPKGARLLLRGFSHMLVILQKVCGVNRIRNSLGINYFAAGSNWFSITNEFATYIVNNLEFIKSVFHSTICGDEEFVQVLALKSGLYQNCFYKEFDNNYTSIMRLIDWERGRPYIWRYTDYDELMGSDFLFARKFDKRVDEKIIEMIADSIRKKED